MPKVVTANTLSTGHVVFLGPADVWVPSIADAIVYDDATAADQGLVRARHAADRALIVEPFLVDKGPGRDGKATMTLRDSIRAYGPTIRYLPADASPASR